ncbi:MAG TPA: hypothetical protein VFQ53_06325 [Kofleriaceae bacterium]|nr:hypothetical protein [Kofleriaceae bacterium]
MHRLALAIALGGVVAVALPAPGALVALGLGIFATAMGWLVYRRRAATGAVRLAGAAALTIGLAGVVLAAARIAITFAAIGHLERMLS